MATQPIILSDADDDARTQPIILSDADNDIDVDYVVRDATDDDDDDDDDDDEDEIEVIFVDANPKEQPEPFQQTDTGDTAGPGRSEEAGYPVATVEKDDPASLFASITQPNKKQDDSSISFGDTIAQTIGAFQYAPSAPAREEEADDYAGLMDEQIQAEYEKWLRETAVAKRRQFKHHRRWEDDLRRSTHYNGAFTPTIKAVDFPTDSISMDFKMAALRAVAAERGQVGGPQGDNEGDDEAIEEGVREDVHALLYGVSPPKEFSQFPVYVPSRFLQKCGINLNKREDNASGSPNSPSTPRRGSRASLARPVGNLGAIAAGPNIGGERGSISGMGASQRSLGDFELRMAAAESAWLTAHTDGFDEVNDLIQDTKSKYNVKWVDPTHNTVPQDHLWVISDHNGTTSGKKYEIWGPGVQPRFFAPMRGTALNMVNGTKAIPLNTNYMHMPGRFTIVRILRSEVAFVLDKRTSQICRLLPGRYFIPECSHNYIGKAPIKVGGTTPVAVHAGGIQSNLTDFATRLKVVQVAPGHVGFVQTPTGTFMLETSPDPYVIDEARNEQLVAILKLSQLVLSVPGQLYSRVTLQPGEFIMFADNQARTIIWVYDADNPRLNTIHLPSQYFNFDGLVHNYVGGTVANDGFPVVVFNRPQEFVLLRDSQGNVRFFEEEGEGPFVLRPPWRYLQSSPKADTRFSYEAGEGRKVSRVTLNPAEWAVVQTQAGEIKFFPPLLTSEPYYFYQPRHCLHGVINRFAKEVQHLQLPGYNVTVVNLSTGELGACRIQNVNMFLNPRPLNPYVFVSPDEFLGKCAVEETHFQAGDLHYVRVNSDERMCVLRDGEAILLPPEEEDPAAEQANAAATGLGNGVFIFRARQSLEVKGPFKKIDKLYQLGPWQFFTVPTGHVGYGTKAGKLFVWGEGQGRANNSRNEQFSGFFQTNVDPVIKENVEVMCKHAITSHLKISVTYQIEDALRTIATFGGEHEKLHRFVESLAVSKILELCATKPPMGFAESDFNPEEAQLMMALEEEDTTSEEDDDDDDDDDDSDSDTDVDAETAADAKSSNDGETAEGDAVATSDQIRQKREALERAKRKLKAKQQKTKLKAQAKVKRIKQKAKEKKSREKRREKRREAAQKKRENDATDKSKMSGELLQRLRGHPEIQRAGIHIGFAEIQEWAIDSNFMASSKDIAMQLQKTHAEIEKKRMFLQQQKLDNARAVVIQTSKIEQQRLQNRELMLQAQFAKEKAEVEAQQATATKRASAEADAQAMASQARAQGEAAVAKREAGLRQEQLAAESAKRVALMNQERQEIENETNVKRAEADARVKMASVTAEKLALAKASQEAAQMDLEACKTLLEGNRTKAQASLLLIEAEAKGQQMLAEAKLHGQFPGLDPATTAQCTLLSKLLEVQQAIAGQTRQVVHTMDPQEAQKIYSRQLNSAMAMARLFNFSTLGGGGVGGVGGGGVGGVGIGGVTNAPGGNTVGVPQDMMAGLSAMIGGMAFPHPTQQSDPPQQEQDD